MSTQWIKFLLIALAAMAICLGGIGGWLLPSLGYEGPLWRALAAGIGGAIVAILYVKMIKRADGA